MNRVIEDFFYVLLFFCALVMVLIIIPIAFRLIKDSWQEFLPKPRPRLSAEEKLIARAEEIVRRY